MRKLFQAEQVEDLLLSFLEQFQLIALGILALGFVHPGHDLLGQHLELF